MISVCDEVDVVVVVTVDFVADEDVVVLVAVDESAKKLNKPFIMKF